MIVRPEALKALAAHRTGEIVVSIFTTAFEWLAISPSDLNYTFIDAMGQTASHGLGLALAFPGRRVIVLDGDGSLLMNLGCLVTTAAVAPRNFVHVLFNNAMYEQSGGQPTPGAQRTDFAGIARAAGFPIVHEYDDLVPFRNSVPELLVASGPIFVELKVVAGPDQFHQDWGQIYAEERQKAFRRAAMLNAVAKP
jgi:sulfopyruvate decarboxylase subunit beta